MGITVQHVKTSLIADDADTSLVRPSDWNSTHAITFSPDASEVIKVISAGAQSVSSGSVVFANSNGVTFGMNNGTITASVPAVGGAQTGISGIGAAGGTATSGTVIFSNSNGLAFGMNGQTMTGSYTVPTQTAFVLSNSNNVSFGTNGSTVTASASFPAQTVDTNKAGTGFTSGGAGIGLSGTLNTNGLSLSATVPTQTVQPVAVSGSNGSFAFSTVSFGNSNGLSFYSTNGSLVGSYTVPSVPAQTQQPMYFSASNSNTSANTLQFGNSNGVSFSISNGSLVATVKTDYLTSQTAQTAGLYAAGNTTGQSSSTTADARSLSFQGAGVASVGYSNGSVIVSVPSGGGGGDGFNQAGFTNSTANSTMSLVWAGNSAGSGNVTMGLTGSTITMSAPAGAGGGIAAAAGTQTATSGTVAFANSNGISFGMSGSSQITATYTVPSTAGLLSAINISAGTTSGNLSAVTFNNAGNVSFGLNAGTVTATATFAQTVQPAVAQLNGSSGTMSFAVGSSLSASSNASTVTFGLASNITTALQSAGAYLTTAMASNAGSNFVGLNSALTANGVSASINSSGISLNFPAFLTTAALSNHSHNLATTTTNGSLVVIATTNSAGATMAVPPFLTTAAQSDHSHGNPTLALTNLTGTTASASNGFTLSLSAAAPGAGGGIALANSQTTYTSGTASIMAGGGAITVASNTGQRIDISVPALSSISVTGVLSMSVNGSTISIGAPAAAADGINVVMLGTTGTTGTSYSASTGTVYLNGTGAIVVSQNNSNQIVISYSGGTDVEGASLIGNVVGNSTVAPGTNGTIYLSGGNNVTLSGTGNTVVVSAAAGGAGADVTFLTYQNRQLGASASTQFTNNQIWMVPFRVAGGYVSASTGQYIQSLGGTYTSAVAATHAETMNWCLYSNNTTNSTRLDTWASGQFTWQVWNSGTSSGSYAMNGSTSSSAGTGIFTQISGARVMQVPFGSSVPPGLYVLALRQSTSSAGYSALLSRYGIVVDSPMPLAMGNGFGSAAATSIGYVDAGTYSVTSTAFPASIGLSEIRQHSNLVPYFKMGAI